MSSHNTDQAAAAADSGARVSGVEQVPSPVQVAYELRCEFTTFVTVLRATLGSTLKDFAGHFAPVMMVTLPIMDSLYGSEPVELWLQGNKDENGWRGDGALHKLIVLFYEDCHRFGVGDMGSVWFDADLTGAGKTKKTRVSLDYDETRDQFIILLDATFDDTW